MFNKIKNEIKTEVEAMNIGNNISALRKKKGITQEELANELGVSAQAVSKWENNSSCPDVSLLTEIADYFGVSVDALLRAEGENIIDETENKDVKVKPSDDKKNIVIRVTQQNGKENIIKVPFKLSNGIFNKIIHYPIALTAANFIKEIIKHLRAENGMSNLRMELNGINIFLNILHSCARASICCADNLKALRNS